MEIYDIAGIEIEMRRLLHRESRLLEIPETPGKLPEINWKMLQVKNSDNSENSSSKKIREGTQIKHWFRRFSKQNKHNWEKLHKILDINSLTEENFIKHLEEKI